MSYTDKPTSAVAKVVTVWLPRLLALAAFGALAYVMIPPLRLFVEQGQKAVAFPYPLNYGEGPLLDQTLKLARLENIYHVDLDQPPYTIANYPPLFMLSQIPLIRVFGASYAYGRLFSLVCIGLTALCLGLTVRTLTKDGLAALASGAALFAVPYVLHWSALYRIDSLALALSWLGLLLLAQFPRSRAALVLAALLLTAAIYTRQSYALAAPLAGFVWLLSQPRRYRALLFALLIGTLTLWLFNALQALTRGGFFFHVVTANVNPFKIELVNFYLNEIVQHLPLFLSGGVAFLLIGWLGKGRAWTLVAPYSVGAALSALTIGKVGSDVNYLYELSAAFCLVAGAWIGLRPRFLEGKSYAGLWHLPRAALILALAWQIDAAYRLGRDKYAGILDGQLRQEAAFEQFTDLLRDTDGAVLADEYMGLLPLAGKPILLQPFEMTQLAGAGLWDDTPVVSALQRREFALVLVYQPSDYPGLIAERWTSGMRRALNDDYPIPQRIGQTTVYRATQ